MNYEYFTKEWGKSTLTLMETYLPIYRYITQWKGITAQ